MKEKVKSKRNIVFSASAATESGEHLAEGIFDFKKTDTALNIFWFCYERAQPRLANVHVATLC